MDWREEWTASAVAQAVRDGRATAAEAAEEALRRIDERDGMLCAFVQRRARLRTNRRGARS